MTFLVVKKKRQVQVEIGKVAMKPGSKCSKLIKDKPQKKSKEKSYLALQAMATAKSRTAGLSRSHCG